MEIKELELKAAEALEKAEKALKERTYYTRANDIAYAIMAVDEAIAYLKQVHEKVKTKSLTG